MTNPCIDPRADREAELALLAGGDLAAPEAARAEAHAAACPACRELLHGLRESQGALAALADEPVDPEAVARVRHAVHRRIEEEAARDARRPAWALALAAGLVLAVLAAAVWLERSGRDDGGSPAVGPARVAEAPAAAEAPDAGAGERPRTTLPPRPAPETLPAPVPEAAPAPPRPASASEAPVRRAAAQPPEAPAPARPAATEPMVIQVVSDDPDIVFYWLVEPEETEDETVSS